MLFSKFWRSKDQKCYKNLTKETVFVCILGFIFHGVSHAKTDSHKNFYTVRLSFVFSSISEQDHLLHVIILGVYGKRRLKCARISKQKLM